MRERDNHMANDHSDVSRRCRYCFKRFNNSTHCTYHERTCSSEAARIDRPKIQQGYGNSDIVQDEEEFVSVESAFNNGVQTLRLRFTESTDLLEERLLLAVEKAVSAIQDMQQQAKPFKFQLTHQNNFHKPSDPGLFTDPAPGVYIYFGRGGVEFTRTIA